VFHGRPRQDLARGHLLPHVVHSTADTRSEHRQ
jgi:hypothetical protein